MSRRVPLRWRWTDRGDQGMSRKAGILSGRAGTGVFCGNFSFLSWMSSAVLEMGPLCDSTSVFEISVAVHDYGEVNKKQIPDLPTRAEISECGILLKDA